MVASWQLVLGLHVISALFIPDWDVDTQNTDMFSSEWVPGNNEITNNARLALATSDGRSEFALPPDESNLVSSEISIAQGSSRCAGDIKRLPRRMRAKEVDSCPADILQLNDGERNGRRLSIPVVPDAQQGGGGPNSPKSPKRRVVIPSTDDLVQLLFIPKENRPKPNPQICPKPLHPIPVCGKPSDVYFSINPAPGGLMVDPCYPCKFILFFSGLHLFP